MDLVERRAIPSCVFSRQVADPLLVDVYRYRLRIEAVGRFRNQRGYCAVFGALRPVFGSDHGSKRHQVRPLPDYILPRPSLFGSRARRP
jgi:hypothetical protein